MFLKDWDDEILGITDQIKCFKLLAIASVFRKKGVLFDPTIH